MAASRAEGQPQAAQGRGRAGNSSKRLAAKAAERKSDADACGVENGGCEDETDGEFPGAGFAELTAMGMPMEESEEADHGGDGARRNWQGERDGDADENHRGEDDRLDEGQGDARNGSGEADVEASDEKGRVRVPPDKPAYTLRRVWLTPEEETGYYYGASNSAIWPR